MASNRCFRRWSKRLPSVFEAFRSSSARLSCCSWTCWCMLMPYLAMLTWRENKWKQWQGLTRRLSTSSHTLTRCALMVSFTCGYYPCRLCAAGLRIDQTRPWSNRNQMKSASKANPLQWSWCFSAASLCSYNTHIHWRSPLPHVFVGSTTTEKSFAGAGRMQEVGGSTLIPSDHHSRVWPWSHLWRNQSCVIFSESKVEQALEPWPSWAMTAIA